MSDEQQQNQPKLTNYKDLLSFRSEDDIKVREQQLKRDTLDIQKVKNDLDQEEKELKNFFNKAKKPIGEDPTVARKKRYDEKMQAYKEVLEEMDLKNLVKKFLNYEPPTPEEIEILYDCRQYTKVNMMKYSCVGLAFTTFNSYRNRRFIGFGLKSFGFGVGLLGGSIFGILMSTEYTLKQLEGLGQDYTLGRLAINEIEDFRMDKQKNKIFN